MWNNWSYGSSIFSFLRNLTLFPIKPKQIIFPTANENFFFTTSLLTLVVYDLFDMCHLHCCEMESHFLDNKRWTRFYTHIGHPSFLEVFAHLLFSFLDRLLFIWCIVCKFSPQIYHFLTLIFFEVMRCETRESAHTYYLQISTYMQENLHLKLLSLKSPLQQCWGFWNGYQGKMVVSNVSNDTEQEAL